MWLAMFKESELHTHPVSRKWTRMRSMLLVIIHESELHTICETETDRNELNAACDAQESELRTNCEFQVDKN